MKLVGLLTFGKTSDLLNAKGANGQIEQTFQQPITAAWTVPEWSSNDGTGFPVDVRNEKRTNTNFSNRVSILSEAPAKPSGGQ